MPSKSVPKTLYELWTERVPSLNHLFVWGSPAEAKVFNPNIRKLDPKTVSCYFIGYLERLKGFHFYCQDRHAKFVEVLRLSQKAYIEKVLKKYSMYVCKSSPAPIVKGD